MSPEEPNIIINADDALAMSSGEQPPLPENIPQATPIEPIQQNPSEQVIEPIEPDANVPEDHTISDTAPENNSPAEVSVQQNADADTTRTETEDNPNQPEVNQGEKDVTSPIADIVNVDTQGRGHITGSDKRNGQFMSAHEMGLIEDNQELIRNGLDQLPQSGDTAASTSQESEDQSNTVPQTNESVTPQQDEPAQEPSTADNPETPPESEPAETTPTAGSNEALPDHEDTAEPETEDSEDGKDLQKVVQEKAPEILAFEQAKEEYESAVKRYAHAKIRRERLLAGKDARQLFELAGEDLKQSRQRLIEANASLVNGQDKRLLSLQEYNLEEKNKAEERLAELFKQRGEAGEHYDGGLDGEINELTGKAVNCLENNAAIQEVLDNRAAERAANDITSLTTMTKQVDDAMIKERTEAHPLLSKVTRAITRHPKVRIIVGAAFTAIGVIGAATLNAPLVALSTAGSSALSGYGSYNLARGIGDVLASRRLDKAQIETIEDYLAISDQESSIKRTSKIAGTTLAAASMIAAPLVGHIIANAHHASTTGTVHPPVHGASNVPPSPVSPTPPPTVITPVSGNTLPWNFGQHVLHTNISNPAILDKLVNNSKGIKFVGNGLGGGLGAIKSVSLNGVTYTDLGHINGAIQAILG